MTTLSDDLKQTLYLIADEMRGMATLGDYFAGNIYEVERAHRIMALAAKIASVADEEYTPTQIKAFFDERPWFRISPVNGVEAVVFNPAGEMLLLKRKDNAHWAIPGGVAEVGQTLSEGALRELWEEAGMRGEVTRLLGMFDNRLWGEFAKVHSTIMVFLVTCQTFTPTPGIEMLEAGFFALDQLPQPLHPGHDRRIPVCFALYREGTTHIDPASSDSIDLAMHQRPT